jgi:hypothetical protein
VRVGSHADATNPIHAKNLHYPGKNPMIAYESTHRNKLFLYVRGGFNRQIPRNTHILKRGRVAMLMLQTPYTQKIYTIPAKI